MAHNSLTLRSRPLPSQIEASEQTERTEQRDFAIPLDEPKWTIKSSPLNVERPLASNGAPFATRCFESGIIFSPKMHLLLCGHTVMTETIVPCGGNCQESSHGGEVPRIQLIACDACNKQTAPLSEYETEGSGSLPNGFRRAFDPSKRRPEATGAAPPTVCWRDHPNEPLKHILNCGHEYFTRRPDPCNRSCKLHSDAESKTMCLLKAECQAEKCVKLSGYAAKVFMPKKMGVKKRKRPTNEQERAEQMQERFARELAVDGTNKLGFEHGKQKRRDYAQATGRPDDPVEVLEPDLSEARPKRQRPHSYAMGGIRNQEAGAYSMPATMHAQMVEAENGVIVEEEETAFSTIENVNLHGRFEKEDRTEQDEEELQQPIGEVDVAETHCICETPADGYMLACEGCKKNFHPSCIGKGKSADMVYDGEQLPKRRQEDVEWYHSDQKRFTCLDCDTKLAKRKKNPFAGRASTPMEEIRMQAAEATRAKADEYERYKPQYMVKMRLQLKRAGKDPVAKQAVYDRFKPLLKDVPDWDEYQKGIDRELFGEEDDPAPVSERRAVRTKTQSQTIQSLDQGVKDKVKHNGKYICDGCEKHISGVRYRLKNADPVLDFCEECAPEEKRVRTHAQWLTVRPYGSRLRKNWAPAAPSAAESASAGVKDTEMSDAPPARSNDEALPSIQATETAEKPAAQEPTDEEFLATLSDGEEKPEHFLRPLTPAVGKRKPQTRKQPPSKRAKKATSMDVEMGEASSPGAIFSAPTPKKRASSRIAQKASSEEAEAQDKMEE